VVAAVSTARQRIPRRTDVREPYTQLYIHLVWATWNRFPLITSELRSGIYAGIQAKCRKLRVEVVAIGGMEDHVHLLARIPTTISIALLAQHVKGSSSHLATHRLGREDDFKWQGAYGAFSVSKSEVPRIRDYVLNQERHHREQTLDPDLECPPEFDRHRPPSA
jgi:REP element-mobilizing transposase RayT